MIRKIGVLVCATVMLASSLNAGELRFARHFSDNMVIQRDKPILVKGFADKGATVTVCLAGQTRTATADDGTWAVTMDPVSASDKTVTLTAASSAGNLKCELKNVIVGDVILFARQTSIDISLGRDESGRTAAVAQKNSPLFRAISIKTIPAGKPQSDLTPEATAGWAEVSKESALKMTAAAYYLGRDLVGDLKNVPVGIVDLNLGPAFPISWLNREALEETEKFYGKSDVPTQIKRFDAALELAAKGEKPAKDNLPSNITEYPLFPAGGYNAVLNPLKGLALKAALVQLGNDYPYMIYAELEKTGKQFDRALLNDAYVQTYDIRKNGFRMEPVTTPRIPREWRKVIGDDALPMGLIVPPGSDLNTSGQHNREMRELQRLVAEDTPGVSVILPGTEHIAFSAQPADEALIARRCASWINGSVYSKSGAAATGPMFERLDLNFNEATINFKKGTADGLKASGGSLDNFEAAGVEGDYVPVKAVIEGDVIRITSDSLDRIFRVRYNWNSKPDQGLVNAAGLPMMPFRSEKADYHWFVTNKDDDLPEEYYTPANQWKQSDVTLINGQLKTHGYKNFTGWLGPIGVRTGPFGPNMGVRTVKAGSPAEGKLLEGDVIYSANGKLLGEKAWEVMADAITQSETRAGAGKLVLGVRRGSRNIDVEVTLEIMGEFSSTAPYDCAKTEKIIKDLEQWVLDQGAGAGFLNTDALFMLATGNPELQGYVRRIVYGFLDKKIQEGPLDGTKAGKSWQNSAEAILLGEYFMATGDRTVLPHLKYVCDRLAATQHKEEGGWRHNFPGGSHYGLIPNAGIPGVMGMYFATQAGVVIDMESYALGLKHFREKKAETGFLIYGLGGCERPVPNPFDPEDFAAGRLDSYNGGLSAAGILMRFSGEYRAAHLCSLISAYAWNNTFGGHGGNFWNNFWTPIGAHDHGKKAFINFWKNYSWYRELNRMYDGSIIQGEDGKSAAGCGVALVAPRQRIQITGAPRSPFATNAPAFLGAAINSYWKRDYAGCEKQVSDLIAGGVVGKDEMPTTEYLLRQAREIQESINIDLARMMGLCEAGNPAQAKTFVAELKAIMPDGDERLAAIEKQIAATKQSAADSSGKSITLRDPDDDIADADAAAKKAEAAAEAAEKAAAAAAPPRTWERLVSELPSGADNKAVGETPAPNQASTWKILVVEDLAQASEGWTKPGFDDSAWKETNLPISWRMYHTALLRTKFNIKDKDAYDGLRFHAWLFRQQGVEIYLNGEMIGKVNNLEEKTGDVDADFNVPALKHLKNGENTLAVTTRHNWRWGMLFMSVYNDGFDFNLEARKKKAD